MGNSLALRAASSQARHLSTRLTPVVEPGRAFSSPLVWETIKEKSPYFRTGSYLK